MGLKLLAAGMLMLAGAFGLMIFSNFNPAQLFIGGGVCAFLGLAHLLSRSNGRGPASDAGDTLTSIDDAGSSHF